MRVNVYNEELTNEVVIVEKVANTGRKFYGVRFLLKSPRELHHEKEDDDRSAVTIWGNPLKLLKLMAAARDVAAEALSKEQRDEHG